MAQDRTPEMDQPATFGKGQLLTVKQVGERLGFGRVKLYRMLTSGELPALRIGRSWRVPEESLLDWIAGRTSGGF